MTPKAESGRKIFGFTTFYWWAVNIFRFKFSDKFSLFSFCSVESLSLALNVLAVHNVLQTNSYLKLLLYSRNRTKLTQLTFAVIKKTKIQIDRLMLSESNLLNVLPASILPQDVNEMSFLLEFFDLFAMILEFRLTVVLDSHAVHTVNVWFRRIFLFNIFSEKKRLHLIATKDIPNA